jgi:hypothetical protein
MPAGGSASRLRHIRGRHHGRAAYGLLRRSRSLSEYSRSSNQTRMLFSQGGHQGSGLSQPVLKRAQMRILFFGTL